MTENFNPLKSEDLLSNSSRAGNSWVVDSIFFGTKKTDPFRFECNTQRLAVANHFNYTQTALKLQWLLKWPVFLQHKFTKFLRVWNGVQNQDWKYYFFYWCSWSSEYYIALQDWIARLITKEQMKRVIVRWKISLQLLNKNKLEMAGKLWDTNKESIRGANVLGTNFSRNLGTNKLNKF